MTFYQFSQRTVRVYLTLLWRFKTIDMQNVPLTGACIVAANHVSYFDPPALGCALPRKLHYMAKAELFEYPILKQLIPRLAAFPVARGKGDIGAIKRSVAILRQGEALGMFPEGTRNRDGTIEAQTGVALLASMTGAPVVPAYIAGTDRLSRFPRITVTYGEPLHVERSQKASREELAKITAEIMARIGGLRERSGPRP
jgi:1-acyl-sn-glycerol-3-phosphate acyltransferase